MVRNVAPVMRELEPEDIHLLSGIEHGMRMSEWVNRSKLPDLSGLTEDEITHRLDRCMDFELIERRTIQYEGFRLLFEGYDALALHTFAERETITEVGAPLGEGKESDVLEAKNEKPVALKFHREGLTNFREVHREREYTADHQHVSWMYTARKAAEQEYHWLTELEDTVRIPEPIDQNRHAIVMERIDGIELVRAKLDDPVVRQTLFEILREVTRAYEAGIIHTDLSEYNVFVTSSGPVLFDWPQAVSDDHPNASELLKRDVENILRYFRQKYPSLLSNIGDVELFLEAISGNDINRLSRLLNK